MTLTLFLRRPIVQAVAVFVLMVPGLAVPAEAQTAPAGRAAAAGAPPVRKTRSDIVVTARRIATPLSVDGRIDEAVYRQFPPFANLIQQEPVEGAPASEKTETWIFFDDRNLYVAARCYDTHPEKEVVTEMRRDNVNIFQNESFTVVLDTFRDLRNGFMFQTNALGGVRDQAIVDQQTNESWNTVWSVRAARGDWGWSVEIAVPFKSLRYPGAGPQTWGINLRRVIKWKNEYAYLTAMPRAFGINNAISRMGEAATLVGLETPAQSKNLELKPYVGSSVTTNRTTSSPFDNRLETNSGFDFKYGLTRGLILDTTVNTDFAQVEEDQQQVNLTRFSLFFPEKRDFFLEGQGLFSFGGATGTGNNPGEVPVLFFSRQVGLSNGQAVPVLAGARLTGRAGAYQIGAVNVETRDKPAANAVATNFTAVRVKRDFLQRSNLGVVATRRSPTASAIGENFAYGVDANLFLFRNVTGVVYYARTDSPGRSGGRASYRGRFEFAGDRWGYLAEHLLIGPGFSPEIGYVRRTDFRRSFGQLRFSPRPRNNRRVRKYSYTASMDYITDAAITSVQQKELRGQFNTDYQNGDALLFDYTRNYEFVPSTFVINPGTSVPRGGYDYQNLRAQYTLGTQRRVSGRIFAAHGSLYRGAKTEAGYAGRIGLIPQFAIEPSVSLNWVRLPYGDFEAPVVSTRVIFTPNARTALTSFIQYNGASHVMSSSVRLRWEYRGGSELFLVYSDGRNTLAPGFPDLLNRSFAVKVTRLLRF